MERTEICSIKSARLTKISEAPVPLSRVPEALAAGVEIPHAPEKHNQEEWLSLTAAFYLAKGYRPSLNACLRYIVSGLYQERLRAERHANRWMTKVSYVNDFIERSTQAKIAKMQKPVLEQTKTRSVKAREKAIEKAERDLARV